MLQILHADTEICFELLKEADFGFVHQVLTFTRRHNESISSRSNRLCTKKLENYLGTFTKYGPVYLTSDEMYKRTKEIMKAYYRFLAQSILELKSKEFWVYQIKGMKTLGHPMRASKLIAAFLLELIDLRTSAKRIKKAIYMKLNIL